MNTMDFDARLAPYAAHSSKSRGRQHPEPPAGSRSEFQRDRDRIIHSTAFRRLEYKTQVFLNHEGDLFRTRLTHSIEVAQIGRTLARSLGLNEDLVEATALAHDLGHTPFGHVGQDVLNECMKDYGGFEHNLQSLRVVDKLEEHYGAFDGLNLTFETREGILKHCSLTNARQLGELGQRFIDRSQPSLEAQLTNLADEIAYNNHDIDDGLRSGLLTMAQMDEVPLFARHRHAVEAQYPGLPGRRALYETIRLMITAMTADLVDTSAALLKEAAPQSIDDVRAAPPLIRFSPQMRAETTALKRFLYANLYRHFQVNRMRVKASRIVRELFDAFMTDPVLLPNDYQVEGDPMGQARKIADYIAGMTDRYAIREHRRIFSLDHF
ncbi:deoxyguanosinetriphosphate triphosphohydrolase [Massilia sp. LjRoot122]|uniref:deoxyguanosinetriphosphate triphosphohydrolase n=1 Tax=Massilia sp. LjRoot122 TaxID=3342257 RepID=UPI003F4FA121